MMNRLGILYFLMVLSACSLTSVKNDYGALRKEAIRLALEHLSYRTPPETKGYAGIGATKFINGSRLYVGNFEARYRLTGNQVSWRKRLHEVIIKVPFKHKKIKDILTIRYTFRDKDSKTADLKLEYVYGAPSSDYFHKEDPLKKFRKKRRIISALKRREVFVGMPLEAVLLSWGKPQSKNSMISMRGKEQQYIYGRHVLYIKNSKVVKRGRL